ncbi:MAG: ATP-binding protein [Stenotrophomonas sp. 14-69-23]|nr:MAG: ATP-binding protein [Stenotrophomonas sp. 14-69-23]
MATPVLLSWSGGKDAAWALHALRQRQDVEVVALLSTLTEGYERASMQGVREEVLRLQAHAAGLPLLRAWIPQDCDNAGYLQRMGQALEAARLRWPALRTLAFGDLLLEDIRHWRQQQYAALDWDCLFPLFGRDTATLARQMIDGGLRARLDALPASVDACGENGEFHTCVSAGPMFGAPLRLRQGDTVLRDARYAYTDFAADDGPS